MNCTDGNKLSWLISIDGLDCSGKETFAKMLCKFITANINSTNPDKRSNHDKRNIKVHLLSFPDYNNETGKKLQEMLKLPVSKRNQDDLSRLFRENRKEVLDNLELAPYNILIFDRFITSNIIYGMLPHMIKSSMTRTQATDMAFYKLLKEATAELEYLDIWSMDRAVIFSRFGSKASARKHDELLAKKENKDSNETPNIQARLSKIIDMYLTEDVIEEVCVQQHNDTDTSDIATRLCIDEQFRTNVKIGKTFNKTRCMQLIGEIFPVIKIYLECFGAGEDDE